MIPFLLYIIKLSCCLTFFYVGYKLLLSHETFFHFNRKILLTGILTCMLLPLIKVETATTSIIQQPIIQLEKIMMEDDYSRTLTISYETANASRPAGKQLPSFSVVELLALIFVTGSCIHLCMLIRSHISLCLLIRSGRKIKRGDCTFVLFDRPVTPFNYGNYIILSERDYRENPETILTHELVHFHLLHSFDIAFVELLSLFQWFNPAVWLLKKEVRNVHEFQADAEVLQTGIDTTTYQLLLVRKAVDSGPYTFANSFNHSKIKNIKNRFTMMTKKKSNSWAQLKLLLLLPIAALCVYACARPESTRQVEQMLRNGDTTILSNNQTYTPDFFEAELNKYISELGGNPTLPTDEKYNFLLEKTNVVNLIVNAKDQILFAGSYCTTEHLPSDLAKKLVAEYSNKKPALIYMLIEQGTSSEAKTGIFNIVGKIFEENKELFKQKNQPVLLLFGALGSHRNGLSTSISVNPTETYLISIAFMNDTGKELRSFTLPAGVDHTGFINEIKEWLKSPGGESPFSTVSIKASSNTTMGVIIDLKQALRDYYALKISYQAMN